MTPSRPATRLIDSVQDLAPESLSVPGRPEEVASARAFVTKVLTDRASGTDIAVLLVSELVGNSVTHSRSRREGGQVTITVAIAAGQVRAEVTDGGADTVPAVRTAGVESERGRGLQLVDALADRWGFVRHAHETTTWFEIAAL